ncbi:MAG: amino acid ABC transporter permease [Clostridia bacterium]|jgi:His/Glu/Gln/Arg/opine family amino acid ABC transporter permease subunit|nr:amino acid ABC transporter permease [Clostridia bacterium]MBQ1943060.1 amino acid ABC transporter permease [Clostridia bacterium]MBQ5802526.1 amino acid ABC transporter permease [Clostridia bacterium]
MDFLKNAWEWIVDGVSTTLLKADRWKWYVEGIEKTLLISLGAIALGCVIGIIVALIKYMAKKYGRGKAVARVCDVYLTVIRGTPVYLQMLIMSLIVLASANEELVGIITFGINSGAYVAEIIRAGLESVDDGQLEAGGSLGMGRFLVMKEIVLPQAVRRSLPPLCNEFIALIKETSIIGAIGVKDITKVADQIIARNAEPFFPYMVSAAIYLAMVIALTKLLRILERRMAKSDRN